jgi:hypothetical protein
VTGERKILLSTRVTPALSDAIDAEIARLDTSGPLAIAPSRARFAAHLIELGWAEYRRVRLAEQGGER